MKANEILTYDLETCTSTLFKRKASPFHAKNYIVAAGFKHGGDNTFGSYYTSQEDSVMNFEFPDLSKVKMLVGFNIKFDLLYTWHKESLQQFFRDGGIIWDCQYVEYLLEGQLPHAQMISMNETILKYGGTLKLDAVKEMWDAGINTPEIPEDLLMKYLLGDEDEELEGDVNNTWLILMGQLKRIQQDFPEETMTMIKNRMDGLLATTEMEYNGLMVDLELGEKLREEQKIVLTDLDEQLKAFIPPMPEGLTFNWNSNVHKSALLFGGSIGYKKWVQHEDEDGNLQYARKNEKQYLVDGLPVGNVLPDSGRADKYKGGKRAGEYKTKIIKVADMDKPKGAQQDFNITLTGFTTPETKWKGALTDAKDKPVYSSSADIIEELAATRNVPFLKVFQKRTKLKKDLGTYYWDENKKGERKGMLTLVGENGIVHHMLNHTSTKTTRLSSSNPNGQNIPKKDKSNVKQLFKSRFKDGRMSELDYSQLEVVVQGVLSRDKQLLSDLRDKIDFHCKRLGIKLNESYESVKRKVSDGNTEYIDMRSGIKSFTFERSYGAGAFTIALNNNMDIEEVKILIANEERMYPGVIAFDKTVEASINATRKPTAHSIFAGGSKHQLGRGHWFAPTGTKYVWTEYEAPKFLQDRGKYTGFKPTERKNYPVQGFGGEIVQTMSGIVWRWLIRNNRFDNQALLVNTVHDCLWLDLANEEIADKVIPTVKLIMEAVPEKFNRDFNLHIDVPFPVDAEIGTNMFNLTHYEKH